MPTMIISCVMVLLFIGILFYRWLMPEIAIRKGRQVDVKVRSCAKKELPKGYGLRVTEYYEVTVDLYGLNGEPLVRSLQSDTPYMQGDVVRCRYLDKKDILLPEMGTRLQIGTKYKMLLLLAFLIAFVGMVVSFLGE